MSERIELRCGEPLEARTFHALAYDIIGSVEGDKPALAAHASDNKAFLALLKEILRALVETVSEVSISIIGWFSHARLDDKSEWDFEKKHEYYTFIERSDLRTLQGETVKSFEELTIANWLYGNGIEYEYEPAYEHPIPGKARHGYHPDFRLRKSGVYIEHFGVRREKLPDGGELRSPNRRTPSPYRCAQSLRRSWHTYHTCRRINSSGKVGNHPASDLCNKTGA